MCAFFDDGGRTHIEPAHRSAHAAGMPRQGEALLCPPGCVTGVGGIQEKRALWACVFLAARALLTLARPAMTDAIGTLAVRAMQGLHDHDVTQVGCGVRGLSYTRRV